MKERSLKGENDEMRKRDSGGFCCVKFFFFFLFLFSVWFWFVGNENTQNRNSSTFDGLLLILVLFLLHPSFFIKYYLDLPFFFSFPFSSSSHAFFINLTKMYKLPSRGGKIDPTRWASPIHPKIGLGWAIKLLTRKKSDQI